MEPAVDGENVSSSAVSGVLAMREQHSLASDGWFGVRHVAQRARSFDAELEHACKLVLTGHRSVFEKWKALSRTV